MHVDYQIADHCHVVGSGEHKNPQYTMQSDELYRRLTPARTLAAALAYLLGCKHEYGSDWGYALPVRVK